MRGRAELLVLLGVIVLIAVLLTQVRHEDLATKTALTPSLVVRSSYRSLPEGSKALYQTLAASGYQVRRQVRPYGLLPERGTLIVLDPHVRPPTEYEGHELLAWLRRGNHALICLEYHPEYLAALFTPRHGEEEVAEEEIPEWLETLLLSNTRPKPKTTVATPVLPTYLSRQAPELHIRSTHSLNSLAKLPDAVQAQVGGMVPLYRDVDGMAVAYSAVGAGGIVWCNSPWSFSNAGIGQPGNLELVLALAQRQPRAPVIFDEYHHGFGANMTVWSLAPTLTKLGLAQLGLALVLLLVTLGWRFGVARLPAEERFTRSRAEYLTAMAGLLERAGATHVVRERLGNMLRRELGRRMGLPPTARAEQFLDANARSRVVEQAHLERILRQLALMDEQHRPDPQALWRLSGEVQRLLRKRSVSS